MKKITDVIKKSKKIALFTHINPDGDAIGSVFAMGQILNKNGFSADVYINESVPKRLEFLLNYGENPYETRFIDKDYDLFLALDCGDLFRLGDYAEIFSKFSNTATIDHHATNPMYAKTNFVKAHGGSTGELVYDFIKLSGYEIDKDTASLIYSAVASDTGSFKYPSTTKETLICASDLIEKGADYSKISKLLFDTSDLKELKMKGIAIEKLELFYDGLVAVTTLTEEDFKKADAVYEDADAVVDIPRSVAGAEAGIVIKENNGKTKVSIRTNNYVDASALASMFGGGGHIRAAGITSLLSADEIKNALLKEIKELL
jgi:phosphoesterase RecJ-like protein